MPESSAPAAAEARLSAMEQKLRAAAQQWRATFDALGDGVCLLDRAFRIQRTNAAMQKLLNRRYDEFLERRWTEVVSPGARETCEELLRDLSRSRRRETRDLRLDNRWFHLMADPVLDETGACSGAVLVAAEITERKRAEQALRDSEARWRLLFDSVPSSVLLIDENLHVVLANRNFLERMKRSADDTLRKPLAEVFPKVILDEFGLRLHIQQVFDSRKPFHGQRLTYRAPGVPLRIYYYRVIPITRQEHVEHVMLLMDDVTEQVRLGEEVRRVERHLASVVESANEIVLSTDMAGRILTWNRAAELLSGYTLPEVEGHFLFEYCAGDSREALRAFFRGGAGFGAAEYELETRKGLRIPISWVFSPMKDDQGRTVAIVGVGRDLAERRKLEQQLLQSQKLGALGVMAGGIAHEIRSPLTISSSAAQFLMDDDITPEFRRECAGKVQIGIRRASAIIENLLRFAHPSGRLELNEVNLRQVVEEAVTLAANQARLQKIDITREFPPAPVLVAGVAGLLEQVFLNLFLNACHAMAGGGRLRIAVERAAGEAHVRVSDTGCGIAAADIGNIFDPFFTKLSKGTGLGLSICYSIVKQHSGSIEVESTPGEGSTFTVKLPALGSP